MNRLLRFDVWGEYAHFKKYYTTSSPLTFAIPPRTAISGFIGAILGIDKNEYPQYFTRDKASIAVRILHPVNKYRISENFIDTKPSGSIDMSKIKNRTQIKLEVVRRPGYRIYFTHTDETMLEQLHAMIQSHKTVYTPCLGISEFLANFKFYDFVEFKEANNISEAVSVFTASPKDQLANIEFENGKSYFSESLPGEMNMDRSVNDYVETLYERSGQSINVKTDQGWKTEDGEYFLFL